MNRNNKKLVNRRT